MSEHSARRERGGGKKRGCRSERDQPWMWGKKKSRRQRRKSKECEMSIFDRKYLIRFNDINDEWHEQ
jgi:hypothetical protein